MTCPLLTEADKPAAVTRPHGLKIDIADGAR
jgi:hypothetical protein